MNEIDDCELISRSKLTQAEDKATYWFEKHSEAQEDLDKANKEISYWINAYQEEVRKGGRNE